MITGIIIGGAVAYGAVIVFTLALCRASARAGRLSPVLATPIDSDEYGVVYIDESYHWSAEDVAEFERKVRALPERRLTGFSTADFDTDKHGNPS